MSTVSSDSSPRRNRPKLRKKNSSLKDKLFSRHHETKPKLSNRRSNSDSIGTRYAKRHVKRSSSKFVDFVHHTFQKLIHSPNSIDLTVDSPDDVHSKPKKSTRNSHWKPSLETIYDDDELLSALIAFMKRSYNEESIFFLQSVHQLNTKINALCQPSKSGEIAINNQIRSIFELYIAPSAEYQINVSYNCLVNTTQRCQPDNISAYTMNEKKQIFNESVTEIEQLMVRSVLSLFYRSDEFQILAETKCPLVTPSSSPITLSMSQSTLSCDSVAVVGIEHEIYDFDEDAWISMDEEEYLSSLNVESSPSACLVSCQLNYDL
eukprot:208701_1